MLALVLRTQINACSAIFVIIRCAVRIRILEIVPFILKFAIQTRFAEVAENVCVLLAFRAMEAFAKVKN